MTGNQRFKNYFHMRQILKVNNNSDIDKYTDEMRINKLDISIAKLKLFCIIES